MKYFLFCLFIVSAVPSCPSCGDEMSCPGEIRVPFEVIPLQEEYRIGDTIRLISRFDRRLFDDRGRQWTFVADQWSASMNLIAMDTSYKSAVHTSEYLYVIPDTVFQLKHYYSGSRDDYVGQYVLSNDSFFFELRLIPQKTGIVSIYNKVSTKPPLEQSGTCGGPLYKVAMNDSINYNFDLLGNVIPFRREYIEMFPDEYNKSGGFLFRIVE